MCVTLLTENWNSVLEYTLIILEGFDELPKNCRNDGSIFMDLIAGKLLPLATVLVTSRPWATQGIRMFYGNRIYQHIEILGFTGHQITEYIESTLPQDKVSDLKAYLDSHPQIRAGMYIPLNSAIVVTVYEESQASGYAMPTTLTELYTSLTLTLLLRYLHGHPEYKTSCKSLQTFKDLPLPDYTKFREVCKLACSGIDSNTTNTFANGDHTSQVPFHQHTSQQVQLIFRDLPSDFDNLGFMDSVTELYVTRGAVSSHNFLHLTFQEFFAAIHISTMSPAEQMEYFKRHREGRLKVVLRFLAGFNKFSSFSREEIGNSFFQTPSPHIYIRYQMSCDAAIGVDLVQWLFEAQNDDVVELVLGQKTIEFSPSSEMKPLDCYSLGYCISHSQCQWVLELGRNIDEDGMTMLVNATRTRKKPSCKIVSLRGSMSVNMLFTSWKDILHLHQLSLRLPDTSDEKGVEAITASLASNQPLPLERLELGGKFTTTAEESLAEFITNTTTLKYLLLTGSFYGMEVITAALASNKLLALERLELECHVDFAAIAGYRLAQFITNATTLKHLSIQYFDSYLSAHALLVLARAIHHNSALQYKNVEDFTLMVNGENEAKDFVQLLVEYPHMVTSRLSCREYVKNSSPIRFTVNGDNEAKAFAQLLVDYQCQLNEQRPAESTMTCKCISDVGAVALAQALCHNSPLTLLNLSKNSISDAGAVALAQALHDNTTLNQLDLSYNCIGDVGAKALARALHHSSKLRRLGLDLSGNNGIGEEGTHQLVQALTVNSSTCHLSLPMECEEYATQNSLYHIVESSIEFYSKIM